jgi:hypothetical protein
MGKQIVVQSSQVLKKIPLILALFLCVAAVPSAFAANGPGTCATNSESRQLDFWLGDWTISSPGASWNATSTVSLSLDSCVITENWDGGKGQRGENIFAYSYGDQGWRGCSWTTKAARMPSSTEKSPWAPLSFSARTAAPTEKTCLIESAWCAWARTRWNKPGISLPIRALHGRLFFAWNIRGKNNRGESGATHINSGAGLLTFAGGHSHFKPKACASNASEAGKCSAKYDQSCPPG